MKRYIKSKSDLTHLFTVGQKVKCRLEDEMHDGTVIETHPDHIIVDIPDYADHCWFESGYNLEDVYPDYNF